MVITKIPDPLEGLFDNFRGFFTKPSFESFKTIASAIICCIDPKTIYIPKFLLLWLILDKLEQGLQKTDSKFWLILLSWACKKRNKKAI